jgi:hypothetical protein
MARLPLAIPPGVFRNGTPYQSKGRWYDTNLVRWYGAALGPILGWRSRAANTVTGAPRAALAWKDNTARTWLGIGTHSHLYVSNRAGTLFDITPSGFTSGRVDAIAAGGFGSGTFGTGTFGTPRLDASLIQDATMWTLDTWGEFLVGVSPDDGYIYQWENDTATIAAKVTNAPTAAAVVVTPERFMFALGADGDPRAVAWSDQEDDTEWTAGPTTQAGSFPLQTYGRLMCGKAVKGGTLVFTDQDAHLASFIGGNDIYRFDKVGDACGVISRGAVAGFDMQAAWMSQSGFWLYNGYVQEIPCDVWDYIQTDISLLQVSKIVAVSNTANHEIEFRYCSNGSSEIDRCAVWNYRTQTWVLGRIARTCGVDRGVFVYPMLISITGTVYDHEVGFMYDSNSPYGETGPIELGNGDTWMDALGLYPDDLTVGDVTAAFFVKNENDDSETEFGPYTLTSQTDVHFAGRRVRVRWTGATNTAWRVGTPALELVPGDGR